MRIGDRPRLKVTSDVAEATLPDRKRLLRAVATDGSFIQDLICLDGEEVRPGDTVYDPANPLQHVTLPREARLVELRSTVMADGVRTMQSAPLDELADRTADQLERLPQGCLRFINPHRYKVSISQRLNQLRLELMEEVQRGYGS